MAVQLTYVMEKSIYDCIVKYLLQRLLVHGTFWWGGLGGRGMLLMDLCF